MGSFSPRIAIFVATITNRQFTNHHSYGRGAGVGRTREVGVALGVAVAVGVGVGVGEPDWAQYLPPVFQRLISSVPPQTIISLPVSTAV
jgi:hypothetical protein